jgi:hypothetical protein
MSTTGSDSAESGAPGIKSRVASFFANPIWPKRIIGPEVKVQKGRTTSILEDCGVRVVDCEQCQWFLCLMDGCFDASTPIWIKCTKSSTSNATDHLRMKHNTTSKKTLSQIRAVQDLSKQIDLSTQSFKQDPLRWFQLQIAAWAAEQSLSYRSFQTPRWRVIASQLPVGVNGMTVFNPRKHNVELYVTIREKIKRSIAKVSQEFSIPFMTLNLDLYKNMYNNLKFVTLRVGWNSRFSTESYNIAIRRYAPSETERTELQPSNILADWASGILLEFGINVGRHVLTTTSDSGSDVKRALALCWKQCVNK